MKLGKSLKKKEPNFKFFKEGVRGQMLKNIITELYWDILKGILVNVNLNLKI